MKEKIETGLQLINEIETFGSNCQEFAQRARKLISNYSDENVQKLNELFWSSLAPKVYLFQQETADKLIEIVPALKEFNEVSSLLKPQK